MGWTSGSTSNLVGWGGGKGGSNPGANAHGWVDEKGSGSKGTVGQVVDAVAEAAKAEGNTGYSLRDYCSYHRSFKFGPYIIYIASKPKAHGVIT